MIEELMSDSTVDDPRKLSALLARVAKLAQAHNVSSVVVGISCEIGNSLFPEFVEFLRSALRVEDGIYRMTRERAVIHLADLDMEGGHTVFNRLLEEFNEEFPMAKEPNFDINYCLARAGDKALGSKEILADIFPSRVLH
jgi:GGDEF domain-containing protein